MDTHGRHLWREAFVFLALFGVAALVFTWPLVRYMGDAYLTPTSVTIALSSGKPFTNGDETETIAIGETLTVNGDDGTSFVIKLVSVASN